MNILQVYQLTDTLSSRELVRIKILLIITLKARHFYLLKFITDVGGIHIIRKRLLLTTPV